ncbi:MAG TPA: energy transducer TonB [Opitutaceae bacterium]|nr:energy transducer TonB [Opitutaceae bacterium]
MKALFSFAFGIALLFAVSARADDQVEPPVPVRTTAPDYPYELRRAGVSGVVTVSCLVDAHGDVQDMQVVKASNEAFVQPAMEALKKWKFKPAVRAGAHVPLRVSIPIRFTYDD